MSEQPTNKQSADTAVWYAVITILGVGSFFIIYVWMTWLMEEVNYGLIPVVVPPVLAGLMLALVENINRTRIMAKKSNQQLLP